MFTKLLGFFCIPNSAIIISSFPSFRQTILHLKTAKLIYFHLSVLAETVVDCDPNLGFFHVRADRSWLQTSTGKMNTSQSK